LKIGQLKNSNFIGVEVFVSILSPNFRGKYFEKESDSSRGVKAKVAQNFMLFQMVQYFLKN
jgi:hypothetical protein